MRRGVARGGEGRGGEGRGGEERGGEVRLLPVDTGCSGWCLIPLAPTRSPRRSPFNSVANTPSLPSKHPSHRRPTSAKDPENDDSEVANSAADRESLSPPGEHTSEPQVCGRGPNAVQTAAPDPLHCVGEVGIAVTRATPHRSARDGPAPGVSTPGADGGIDTLELLMDVQEELDEATPGPAEYVHMRNAVEGGGPFEFPTPPPPPPSRPPPKFSNLSFSNLRFWGERVGAEGAEFFFLPFPEGVISFFPCVSILKILRILWRIQKPLKLKNTEKFLTPDLTSGFDLG